MSPRARPGGSKKPARSAQRKRRHRGAGAKKRTTGVGFWGDPSNLPPMRREVRITDDPAALARSLGPPPLAGHETIAEHYFAAVYDRAVSLAAALAAAGGLITPEELIDDQSVERT